MIGVFDSGVGGLSIHRALVARLPQADFIYLADQAHTPYGGKTAEEIVTLTRAGCERLFREGASLVVLACNTAAAIALRQLQHDWLPSYRKSTKRAVNILGIIVPTIEAATGLAWKEQPIIKNKTQEVIGIFATPATVRSQVYVEEISKRRSDIDVVQEACPDLAQLIESGADRETVGRVIAHHVQSLASAIGNRPWKAILGCTHYEIVSDLFIRALPANTVLISQPQATANALARYLLSHPEFDAGQAGLRRFITTGTTHQTRLAEDFWGQALFFEPSKAA